MNRTRRGLDPAIQLFSKTMDARVEPGHDEQGNPRGVLKRHCADGKTPLRAARLCNRPLTCQNAGPPEKSRETP